MFCLARKKKSELSLFKIRFSYLTMKIFKLYNSFHSYDFVKPDLGYLLGLGKEFER